MDLRSAYLRRLPAVVALWAAAFSAAAQNGAMPAGQPILFSTPAGDAAASNAITLAAPDARPHDLADPFAAPVPLFNNQRPEPFSLPSGAAAISGSRARWLQKNAEDQRNWALLTPEEILGATTPEKILGGDAQDQENLNPSERFLARQETVATNSFYNNDPGARGIFSRDRNDGNDARLNAADAAQFLNRFGNTLPDNNPFAAQNQENWFKPAAPALPKPDPEQVAAMDRFRQLLNTGSLADAPEKSSGSKFFSAPLPVMDPNLEALPVVNRVGASFTPLSSGIGKPAGLTPLPGIVQLPVAPVVPPSWAPQPPPWQSEMPPTFTVPQRKF